MGNQTNKSEINSTIEDKHLIFPGYSHKLSKSKNSSNIDANKILDKEDTTISKIILATLNKNDNDLFFLEDYVEYLTSKLKPKKFRIKDFEEITEFVMRYYENPLDYLFECYHRSIEIIEIKLRNDYDDSYKEIHRILAYYIGTILTDPKILDIKIDINKRYNSLKHYLRNCNIDELGFLLYDIEAELSNSDNNDDKNGNQESTKLFFALYFQYIYEENKEKFRYFLVNNLKDSLSKNICILKTIFINFPYTINLYIDLSSRDKIINNGYLFQKENYISKYMDISPYEGEVSHMKAIIDITKPQFETNKIINTWTDKFNKYLDEVADFFITMYIHDPSHSILDWAYNIVKLNLDKNKMIKNNKTLSTNGFLMNAIIIINKIFFKEYESGSQNEYNYSNFIIKTVGNIDPLFTLSKYYLPFDKFDRTNPEIVENIINDESSIDLIPEDFNIYTKLFFLQQTIIALGLKNFVHTCENVAKLIKTKYLLCRNYNNDSELESMTYINQFLNIYLNNKEINKDLLRFCEVSTFLIFSLNNKKYSQDVFLNKSKDINYKHFLDDFYDNINYDDNFALSYMPQFVYQNLITISKYIKRYNEESIIDNIHCSKAIIYFSLIFACQQNLIRNPHFRMEIFDIMIFLFSIYGKNENTTKIFNLLNEKFIKESLMVSILRIFVDAERLGTNNQFYEKFVVRAKIMILIENINKGYGHLFEQNIKIYIEKYPEDGKKMINNLLNDLIYLNDECIENLKVIKNYQDLLDDKVRYNKMSAENKRFEEKRFLEKDKIVRAQIKLFNGSLKFLVSICKILQNFLIKNDFVSQLAGYLNYSLNIFGSPLNYELKLKNIKEYNFNPHFILGSILSTYSAFYDKYHFIEGVIKDERSYKFSNFDRAKNLAANNKDITINEKDFNNYIKFVDNLRREEKIIKSEEINYDDAPQEFLDGLTFLIMTDPVKLPKSQVILDRKTIETHLLSDQTDPFNREPLTKEMLIPCPQLKSKIEEYMRRKKEEKMKELNSNRINFK